MKSDILPLFHIGNGIYQSTKLSLEEINKICHSSGCPYFKIKMKHNKYKEENDKKPEYVFWLITDFQKGISKNVL